MNVGIYSAFFSTVNAITSTMPRALLVVCGAAIGIFTVKVISMVYYMARSKVVYPGHLRIILLETKRVTLHPEQPRDTKTTLELMDAIDDSCFNIAFGGFMFINLILTGGGLACAVSLGVISSIAFVITYALYMFIAPARGERHYVLSEIEEIVRGANGSHEEAKRIAREFYENQRMWLEDKKTQEDFFRDAGIILKDYLDQIS